MELKEFKRWRVKLMWSNGQIYEVWMGGVDPDSVLFGLLEDSATFKKDGYDHVVKILGIREDPNEATE